MMDAEVVFTRGLCLFMIIGGAFSLFYGMSRMMRAEWLWNYEQNRLKQFGVYIQRANWEKQGRFLGLILTLNGVGFLLFDLVVICPAW